MIRPRQRREGRRALTLVVLWAVAGCGVPRWKLAPHDRLLQHSSAPTPHGQPAPRPYREWWEALHQGAIRPLGEALSPGRHLRRAMGGEPARDVNQLGQVPDSTWFENRIGLRTLSPERIRSGTCGCERPGPAPGPLRILSGKLEGATPGFVVADTQGGRWVVKLDPPAFPELATGAEAIATRLLHAAGYHVPDNHVVLFHPRRLLLVIGARTRDSYNRRVPLSERELRRMLLALNPTVDGTVRALFSRMLPGTPLGPFAFRGTRHDDPNDTIPHQHRRSLRGLWLFAAWLNHTEAWQINTLDTFIPTGGGLGHVKHHLLGFSATLGAGGDVPKTSAGGYDYWLDWATLTKRLGAFGLYYPYWLAVRKSPYRSVGVFEAHIFDPARWRPDVPNPAFDEVTLHDSYWAAAILARITPAHIAAAVAAAGYTEPGAEAYVARVLVQRREKLLRHVFRLVPALDRPLVERGTKVQLADLERRAGLLRGPVCYRYTLRWNRSRHADPLLERGTTEQPRLDLSRALAQVRRRAGFAADPFLTLSWQRVSSRGVDPAVRLDLRWACGRLVPVRLERDTR